MNNKLVDSLVEIINSLTDEERRSLNQKLTSSLQTTKTPLSAVVNEPFVGMWQDREDMEDNHQWLRQLRQKEWHS